MQVLCMATSSDSYDVQCPCCRQKYAVYYSRQDPAERKEALEAVRASLVEHHALEALASAHPREGFTVPSWDGPLHASAAALLSGAPIRRPSRTKPLPITLVADRQQRRVS